MHFANKHQRVWGRVARVSIVGAWEVLGLQNARTFQNICEPTGRHHEVAAQGRGGGFSEEALVLNGKPTELRHAPTAEDIRDIAGGAVRCA
jgi:hypothetical protein